MRKLTSALVLGFAVSAFALAGCATTDASMADCEGCDDPANCPTCSAEAATMGASNTVCPISGEPVDASIKTVSFQGKEVGFCCAGCAGKFAQLTDAEKAAKLGG